MTIVPVTSGMLQQSIGEPVRASAVPKTDGVPIFPAGFPETPSAPAALGASASGPQQAPSTPAAIAAGDTPGDEILEGLNKRWGRFGKVLNRVASSASDNALGVDPTGKPPRVWSPVEDTDRGMPHGQSGHLWLPADDGGYDNYLSDMAMNEDLPGADAMEGLTFQRTLDEGNLLTLELSTGAKAFESSIKTLVTGQ